MNGTQSTPASDHRHTPSTAVELRGVRKRFGHTQALDGVDLTVNPGETLALLGRNGAGKTTTVQVLLGLVEPDQGTGTVLGRPPRRAVHLGGIAAMMQDSALMPGITVRELLELGSRIYPNPLVPAEVLGLAGLTRLARRRVDKLSGGQAQRVRFALAVVGNPDVLVLDEPTAALDVEGREALWESMRHFVGAGRTLMFATHYLDEVEQNADRVVVLHRGRVAADGTPEQLSEAVGASTVRFRTCARRAELVALPGVTTVENHEGRVSLRTDDADATVGGLLASGIEWQQLDVRGAGLDEAFLALTREDT